MLNICLETSDILKHSDELFGIDLKREPVRLPAHLDLITPLMIVQFLILVHRIVRKGIKKTYLNVDRNLQNRAKGKILTSQTIAKNHLAARINWTYCRFDEYTIDNPENRFLKKCLSFIVSYNKRLEKHSIHIAPLLQLYTPCI